MHCWDIHGGIFKNMREVHREGRGRHKCFSTSRMFLKFESAYIQCNVTITRGKFVIPFIKCSRNCVRSNSRHNPCAILELDKLCTCLKRYVNLWHLGHLKNSAQNIFTIESICCCRRCWWTMVLLFCGWRCTCSVVQTHRLISIVLGKNEDFDIP